MMTTATKPTKQSTASSLIRDTLERGDVKEVRALFAFDSNDSEDRVLFKFRLWAHWFFPTYFMDERNEYVIEDAPFHPDIDRNNLGVYRGTGKRFYVDIAFRGAAKTTRTKLLIAFCIANDIEHYRRYIKVLASDRTNAVQITTDVYNLLINKKVRHYYPEVFQRTAEKREETMASFTTATKVKMQADTVGTEQRGDVQDDARPDLIWFDDFETRKTLKSAPTTVAIWDNMDEAKQGLSVNGSALYNCNYLSERGNVHKLVLEHGKGVDGRVTINPIKGHVLHGRHFDGPPTWPAAYTPEAVETKLRNAHDPAGDYLCTPSAGADIYFDRPVIDSQLPKEPIRDVAGFRMYHKYDPSHRYGGGHDVAKGVQLDSSASVFIDFSTLPAKVVATYANNEIEPRQFAHEIKSEADRYGACIVAVENNKYEDCIGKLRDIYDNLYFTEQKDTRVGKQPKVRYYGWQTNSATKSKMLGDLKQAIQDGHLELSDPALIAEVRGYTRDDLMDKDEDVRMTTRHFDLLIACAIAYQMRDHATTAKADTGTAYTQPAYERSGLDSDTDDSTGEAGLRRGTV